jgi:hypothetical protein
MWYNIGMSNATVIPTTHLSTERFTYSASTKSFSADWSELRDLTYMQPYPDSLDSGFVLVSERTGREIVLVHTGEQRDNDGDKLFDRFIPADPRERSLFTELLIFND